jgi:hypothetical protein
MITDVALERPVYRDDMIRRVLLVVVAGSAVAMLPWTWYLAASLPDRHDADQWRLAWVGFDLALVGCFALASWLGWRRHRVAIPVLAATAALLCCDAWFDILLDWAAPDRWASLLMAALVELPLAALLLMRARDLLVGGMPSRPLTRDDIAVHTDEAYLQLSRQLGTAGPATVPALAAALGVEAAEVRRRLADLGRGGHVRRDRRGRWRIAAQSIEMPRPEEIGGPDRDLVVDYLDRKYDHELRLLATAAGNRDRMGPWGKGYRSGAHLTAAELARFEREYRDLIARYCQLRAAPAGDTRHVLLRFYAFPSELAEPVAVQ